MLSEVRFAERERVWAARMKDFFLAKQKCNGSNRCRMNVWVVCVCVLLFVGRQ